MRSIEPCLIGLGRSSAANVAVQDNGIDRSPDWHRTDAPPQQSCAIATGRGPIGAGPAVAPITGIALFALGVMAWAGRDAPGRIKPALDCSHVSGCKCSPGSFSRITSFSFAPDPERPIR